MPGFAKHCISLRSQHEKKADGWGDILQMAMAHPKTTGALVGGGLGAVSGLLSDAPGAVLHNTLAGAGLGFGAGALYQGYNALSTPGTTPGAAGAAKSSPTPQQIQAQQQASALALQKSHQMVIDSLGGESALKNSESGRHLLALSTGGGSIAPSRWDSFRSGTGSLAGGIYDKWEGGMKAEGNILGKVYGAPLSAVQDFTGTAQNSPVDEAKIQDAIHKLTPASAPAIP